MKLDCELVISKIEIHTEREHEPIVCEISFQVEKIHPLCRERLRVSVDLTETYQKFYEEVEALVAKKISQGGI